MAYQFDKLDELVQQGQANIFGGDPGQQQPQQGAPQQGQVKTSTEGSVAGSTTGSSTPAVQDAPAQQPSAILGAQKAAYEAAKPPQARGAVGKVSSQIQQQHVAQEQKADSIIAAGRAAQTYDVDDATIQKAIGFDSSASQRVKDVLGRKTVNQLGEFTLPTLDVPDVQKLQSEEGIKEVLRRGKGPRYSSGMADFDYSALKKDPQFFRGIQDVTNYYGRLKEDETALPDRLRSEVEKYGSERLAYNQKNIKDLLGKKVSEIEKGNISEADQAKKQLDYLRREGDPDAARKAIAAATKNIEASYANQPRYSRIIKQAGVNPAGYMNIAETATPDQFVSQEEAQQFNHLMELLGEGRTMAASQPFTPYSIDQAGLEEGLRKDVETKRGVEDVKAKKQIDEILKKSQNTADYNDVYRRDTPALFFTPETLRGQVDEIGKGLEPAYAKYYDADVAKGFSDRDLYNFLDPDKRDLNAEDVLSQTDSDLLNSLSGDLGLDKRYSVGSQNLMYQGGLRSDDVKQALMRMLSPKVDAERADIAARSATPEAENPWIEANPILGNMAVPGDSGVVWPNQHAPNNNPPVIDQDAMNRILGGDFSGLAGNSPPSRSEYPELDALSPEERDRVLRQALGGTL